MAVDYETAKQLRDEFDDEFRKRHDAFRMLRRYWQGDYWKLADKESHSIVSVFRDWTARTSDVGPDVKLVHNVVQAVCVKFQTFLTPLPQIRVYVDPPETDLHRRQALTKQRYLYGCWNDEDVPMNKVFNQIAWFLPLMGDCFLGVFPSMKKNRPVPILRSPEEAFPIPGFDGREEALIFSWRAREDSVARNFPQYTRQGDISRGSVSMIPRMRKTGQDSNPHVDIVEYSDKNQWSRWIDGQEMNHVEHNFGFNLFEHLKFIDVPGDIWGHGAVEQVINLNEMGNALYSLMFEAILENVFPRLVLENPVAFSEEIPTGPGAVLAVNAGGKAYFLSPPVAALPVQEQFLAMNEHNIKTVAGMPEVNFGQSPATSVVTGKAINELQGAGTGSTVEMVQGTGIGAGVVAWNEKAIRMGQTMFRDDTIKLHGREVDNMAISQRAFAMSIKGKELVGSTRNEVVFQPAMGTHEKLVMWLQAKGGGLVSNKFIREQIGIPDSEAMEEELLNEAVTGAVLGSLLQQIQGNPDAQNAQAVEQQGFALLQGKTEQSQQPAGQPHPLLNLGGAPPGAAPPPALAATPRPGGPPLPGLQGGTGFPPPGR